MQNTWLGMLFELDRPTTRAEKKSFYIQTDQKCTAEPMTSLGLQKITRQQDGEQQCPGGKFREGKCHWIGPIGTADKVADKDKQGHDKNADLSCGANCHTDRDGHSVFVSVAEAQLNINNVGSMNTLFKTWDEVSQHN